MLKVVDREYADVVYTLQMSQDELDQITALAELTSVLNMEFLTQAFGIKTTDGIERFKNNSGTIFEILREHSRSKNYVNRPKQEAPEDVGKDQAEGAPAGAE